MSLIDTLDVLVHSGRLEPQTAMKVIASFDKSITEVLADKVKARLNFKVGPIDLISAESWAHKDARSKGHLDTYRFCDDVWTFLIKDVNFKLDNQNTVQAEKIKIVSCNAKKPGDPQ